MVILFTEMGKNRLGRGNQEFHLGGVCWRCHVDVHMGIQSEQLNLKVWSSKKSPESEKT